jgi:hypothetical protein
MLNLDARLHLPDFRDMFAFGFGTCSLRHR